MTVEPNKQTQHICTSDIYYTGRSKAVHSTMSDKKLSIQHILCCTHTGGVQWELTETDGLLFWPGSI